VYRNGDVDTRTSLGADEGILVGRWDTRRIEYYGLLRKQKQNKIKGTVALAS
jgi:hypothetical protein